MRLRFFLPQSAGSFWQGGRLTWLNKPSVLSAAFLSLGFPFRGECQRVAKMTLEPTAALD